MNWTKNNVQKFTRQNLLKASNFKLYVNKPTWRIFLQHFILLLVFKIFLYLLIHRVNFFQNQNRLRNLILFFTNNLTIIWSGSHDLCPYLFDLIPIFFQNRHLNWISYFFFSDLYPSASLKSAHTQACTS